jgi:microcystin-dependent protein
MQGYTPVGQSAAGTFSTFATQTGATSHTLTIAEMPAHTHNMHTDVNGGGTVDGHTGFAPNTQDLEPTSSTGGGGAHTNIQPSTVVRFIIKD